MKAGLTARTPRLVCYQSRSRAIPLFYRDFSVESARFEAIQPVAGSQQPDGQSATPRVATPSSTKPQRRRRLRNIIYSVVFLALGLGSGSVVAAILVPPPLPAPDTDEDEVLLSKLRKDLDKLPVVKELRSHREEWLEYEAYMSQTPASKARSMSAGAMQGFRGLGIQKVFWNKKEKRLISIVFFGGGLAGWPGVTHGGAVATVLHENLERAANGPESGSGSESVSAMVLDQFKVEYRKPTQANALFVVKAEVEEGVVEPGYENTHAKVKATLENALSGQLCAEASGYLAASTLSPLAESAE